MILLRIEAALEVAGDTGTEGPPGAYREATWPRLVAIVLDAGVSIAAGVEGEKVDGASRVLGGMISDLRLSALLLEEWAPLAAAAREVIRADGGGGEGARSEVGVAIEGPEFSAGGSTLICRSATLYRSSREGRAEAVSEWLLDRAIASLFGRRADA